MHKIFCLLVTLRAVAPLSLALCSAPAAFAQDDPVASVEQGLVSGSRHDGINRFLGIPFAAPPVGDLRWRPPQPAADWDGIRPAKEHAFDCAQRPAPGIAAPLAAPLSEDCLYLNIWTPGNTGASSGLPVMVWIHGGGFVNGGISPDVFDGSFLASQGLVLVSINYRLGRLGFFAHPALTAEAGEEGLLGNYGLMDQVAALRWIRSNIAAFGGDPERVTVFGESAGGMSVNFLLTSPMSLDMIDGAIVQSGGGRGNLTGERKVRQAHPGDNSLESLGLAFARSHGIEGDGAEALARLRALPADAVVGDLFMFNMSQNEDTYGGPAIDGQLVVEFPDIAMQAGRWSRVPIMAGATSDDIGNFPAVSLADAWLQFGDQAAAAQRAFVAQGSTDAETMRKLGQVWQMIEPARFIVDTAAAQDMPAYHFRFGYVADSQRAQWPAGARHASDVPFAMGTVTARYGALATPEDIAMGRMMGTYWANFARTGDPNGPGLPHWPRHASAEDVVMHFGPGYVPLADADDRGGQLDLVEGARSRTPVGE